MAKAEPKHMISFHSHYISEKCMLLSLLELSNNYWDKAGIGTGQPLGTSMHFAHVGSHTGMIRVKEGDVYSR